MKRDYRKISIKAELQNIGDVEKYIENICDEFNVYNDYYGNIVLCLVSLFEKLALDKSEYKDVDIEFYNDSNGLCFNVILNNESLLREAKLVLEERESILDDEQFNWLFIIDQLADQLKIGNHSLLMLFDIKSINAELAAFRAGTLRSYLKGQPISNQNLYN